jgi:hypothetical protein
MIHIICYIVDAEIWLMRTTHDGMGDLFYSSADPGDFGELSVPINLTYN